MVLLSRICMFRADDLGSPRLAAPALAAPAAGPGAVRRPPTARPSHFSGTSSRRRSVARHTIDTSSVRASPSGRRTTASAAGSNGVGSAFPTTTRAPARRAISGSPAAG